MTTYAQFVAGVAALGISGVARQFSHPPEALNTDDLPAQWVQLPRGQEHALTFKANGGWPRLRVDLVVAIRPVAQATSAENFTAVLTMMDAVSSALRGADVCRGVLEWSIRQDVVEVAGVAYWAVVAEVEGGG